MKQYVKEVTRREFDVEKFPEGSCWEIRKNNRILNGIVVNATSNRISFMVHDPIVLGFDKMSQIVLSVTDYTDGYVEITPMAPVVPMYTEQDKCDTITDTINEIKTFSGKEIK